MQQYRMFEQLTVIDFHFPRTGQSGDTCPWIIPTSEENPVQQSDKPVHLNEHVISSEQLLGSTLTNCTYHNCVYSGSMQWVMITNNWFHLHLATVEVYSWLVLVGLCCSDVATFQDHTILPGPWLILEVKSVFYECSLLGEERQEHDHDDTLTGTLLNSFLYVFV